MVQNIKSLRKDRGFTIVELLVVIVVIGILAAITMVSYTGVTAKANTTKALSNAQSVQTILEVYYADNGNYPATTALVEGGSATTKLPAGIDVVPNAATNPLIAATGNDKFDITYECKGACTAATGGRLTYWDFSTPGVSTTFLYFGDAKAGDTWAYPAS